MRYAIIADIHANLTAFKAVLDDIGQRGGVDEIWCLGDIVGYGPDPHECIALLRRHNHICVVGNHDLAAIGKVPTSAFNPDAVIVCQWTSGQLSSDDVEYLETLPEVVNKEDFTLVHGSPREPVWEYMISTGVARENFNHFESSYCLVGHSHMPVVFKYDGADYSSLPFTPSIGLVLGKNRLIINPGSVGQPRNGDPRAGYAIYDNKTGMVRLYRISYNVGTTQDRMALYNFPVRLTVRLGQGL
ncbi:metallophosphoesterase family protein [Chloroflexota bacterium]